MTSSASLVPERRETMPPHPEVVETLRRIPWFERLEPKHFNQLAEIASIRHVEGGEQLFREGEKEDNLYIVIEGRVGLDIFVPHHGRIRIGTIEPMELFGWSSVTPNVHQRTASASVVLNGLLVVFNSEKLRQLCEQDHDLGYLVMRRLANVIASRLLTTRLQLIDMFADPSEKANV
jgi:CRP/FNR family transcriptional regulator, cyclic AMP receptor protein